MNRIFMKSKLSSNGVLHLSLPVGLEEANREVNVTVDPIIPSVPMNERISHHASVRKLPRHATRSSLVNFTINFDRPEMNDNRRVRHVLRFCIIFLVTIRCYSVGMATDQWSYGITNGSWERINLLQSISQTARVRSGYVVTCVESSNPVERAAAIGWIARTSSAVHVVDLERLLADSLPALRQLAWNALLNLPDPKAAEIVLREIETTIELPPVDNSCPWMVGPLKFPQEVCNLTLEERKLWVGGLEDREDWIRSFVKVRTIDEPLMIALTDSIVESEI